MLVATSPATNVEVELKCFASAVWTSAGSVPS